jgi:hypothetical protein
MVGTAHADHGGLSGKDRYSVAMSAAGKTVKHRDSGKAIKWVFDTGASHHMINDVDIAMDVQPCHISVTVANGGTVKATAMCREDVRTQVGREEEIGFMDSV